jgi:hypothetical protein
LPVADPKLTPAFLHEVKAHYEKFDEPEMLQEKLYMLATSAMPPRMMVKWLQRWNSSAAIRDAHRFPKTSFADSKFPDWLNRATWWAQVSIHYSFHVHLSNPYKITSRVSYIFCVQVLRLWLRQTSSSQMFSLTLVK